MLKNVKSLYILKIFFTFVDECSKLKLVKYNRNFQNIINIDIINYKYFKGRYIKYEENGKGKEYYYNGKLKLKVNI